MTIQHRVLVSAAFASACALTTPASAALFKVPEGWFRWPTHLPEVHTEAPKPEVVPTTPEPPPIPRSDSKNVQSNPPSTLTDDKLLEWLQVPLPDHTVPLFRSLRLARLQRSYHPTAVDGIHDPGVRARITNSLQHQSLFNIAAFVGRERQFRYAVRTAHITWIRKEGIFDKSVALKLLPNNLVNAKLRGPDIDQIFYPKPLLERIDDLNAEIHMRNEIVAYISEASDRVSPSNFASQAQFEKALKGQLASMLAAEKKSDKPRFSFDVISGKLEMPALASTRWLEIKAGELDVYQLAASVAQVVFSSSSVNTATNESEDPTLDVSPAPLVVQNEELNRRELERSLASSDLPYAKSVAANLFAQPS